MKVALFSSARGNTWRVFAGAYYEALREHGIEVSVAVIDDQAEKHGNPLRHAWDVARRQARIACCSVPTMLARIVVYKALLRIGSTETERIPDPEGVAEVHVPTLNSDEAVEAVRSRRCDMVCLMGTRIISKETLLGLGVPVINIHSSDPTFVRGGPPVVWEILNGRNTTILTVHEAVEKIDSGAILRQEEHPIEYSGGLGKTVADTMRAARPKVAALFFQAMMDRQAGAVQCREFIPAQVRVTPSIADSLRADRLCRRSSRPQRA
jgi:hypothetical protein